MRSRKLFYIPDFGVSEQKKEEVGDALKRALKNHVVITADVDPYSYNDTIGMLKLVLEEEQPDVILAEGLSCFFAHTLTGFDRICVNPILEPSKHLEGLDCDLYRHKEFHQYSYDRTKDRDNSTHCWGIFGSNSEKKSFYTIHYPYVIEVGKEIHAAIDIMTEIIVPFVDMIGRSNWIDEYGVHYANYGKVLESTDYAVFRSVIDYKVAQGVNTICNGAFTGMKELIRVTLPDSLEKIGESAFEGCIKLKEVIIPTGVESIPKFCFDGCVSLEQVILPKGLTFIHERAFTNTHLNDVTIPDSVQYVHPLAFESTVKISVSVSRFVELTQESKQYHLLKSLSDRYEI